MVPNDAAFDQAAVPEDALCRLLDAVPAKRRIHVPPAVVLPVHRVGAASWAGVVEELRRTMALEVRQDRLEVALICAVCRVVSRLHLAEVGEVVGLCGYLGAGRLCN